MRLKFSRLISLRLNKGESARVPKNEFWKVQIQLGTWSGNEVYIGGVKENGPVLNNYVLVEDAEVSNTSQYNNNVVVRGLAFKVVQE